MSDVLAQPSAMEKLLKADLEAKKQKKPSKAEIKESVIVFDEREIRDLLRYYYIMQEDRKRLNSQVLALGRDSNVLLDYLATSAKSHEALIKTAMDAYTENHPVGSWMREVHGIGPVISAGILAHIDITKAQTAGAIWNFAGLNPDIKWGKGEKRPFNADLKKLCWHAGECFVKQSANPKCYYGHIYKERKEYEIKRDNEGGNAETIAKDLAANRYGKTTDAYKYLISGHLPQAQLHARARRYAVKIFLSHLHQVMYTRHFGFPPPKPYAIAILEHAHMYTPPNGLV